MEDRRMFALMREKVVNGVRTYSTVEMSDDLMYLRELRSRISHDDYVIVQTGIIVYSAT